MKPARAARLAAVCAGLALGACAGMPSVGPDYVPPASPAPASWQARLPHGGSTADLAGWWQQFDDPTLVTMIEAAQRESATIAQAAGRIEQARAQAVAARAAGLPVLDGYASVNRGVQTNFGSLTVATASQLGVQAGWELDLFGRIARDREASAARLDASVAGWHDARVLVAAETAVQYLQYRYCESLVAIAEADYASRAETAAISEKAAAAGFQAPAAAALAGASAAEAANRRIVQRAECDVIVKALVALTGLDEPAVRAQLARGAGRLPAPREFAVREVPAALLSQRPDLAAAERELAAASADIGVAEGARYPRLSLLGSIGPLRLDSGSASITTTSWSIGPALEVPLFDGGRRVANVEAARAAYVTAESVYRERTRRAVREVEEALVRLAAAADRETDAQAAVAGYRVSYNAAQVRWRSGLGSLLELEETRRLLLSAESTLAAQQRDRVAAWVALYRALGGGWNADALAQSAPASPAAQASKGTER